MSREQIVQRMLSQISGVPYQLIKDCSLADQQWSELFKAASRLQDSKLFIDDSPRLTIYELRSRARKMKKRSGLDLVVVDYLTKISPAHSKDRTRDQEVTEIAEDLKALAKELKIPVLCLAQLNRKCEERPNKRPRLSDLRESGGIEQAADDILFLYRDEVYNKAEDNPLKNVAEIIVAKQRNGPEGTVKLRFDGPTMNFQNLIPSISSSEVDNGHF
jgi:replicative DNA helicase